MKKIFTLLLATLLMSNVIAQKVDYDNDSRWFWGLNIGAAWNTTDVTNKTDLGYGLIIGKQLNYNYGRPLSFDIRMRYLKGFWSGQDFDTTSLTNYAPAYLAPELQEYQNNQGHVVNNFQTEVHELGLELAIHANRMRERSGWDPYIFGGINLTWSQTYGDLVFTDSSLFSPGQYDYTGEITKPLINSQLDGVFDTPLNKKSEDLGWGVDVMPSLGVGLGYQIGPRFSMGIEWKTTFALRDDWDGYEDTEKRWGLFENDVYHYTNGYMRFHIRARKNNNPVVAPPNGGTAGTNGIVEGGCNNPLVSFINPSNNGEEVEAQLYVLRAKVTNISAREQVRIRVNGSETSNFFYNAGTKELDANISLNEGTNNIQISATNACGTEVQNITINYVTCKDPVINFTAPTHSNFNVDKENYVVSATVINGATSVSFSLNGVSTNNFFYNNVDGSIEANVTLQRGNNTILIKATNECGTVSETVNINFTDCEDPFVQFIVPTNLVVTEAVYIVKAKIMNVDNQNNIGFRVNGANKTYDYNATSNILQSVVNLIAGVNTIEIFASNDCGSEAETITITYNPCIIPVITMINPVGSTSQVVAGLLVKANVVGITSASEVQLVQNGVNLSGGTYNPTSHIFEKSVTLAPGINSFILIATNGCDSERTVFNVEFKEVVVVDPEETMIICHHPPGNPENTQELEIPISAWAAHKAHGDTPGPCPEVVEETMVICHHPPGNPTNTQELEIPISAWAAHQAHGDTPGPCPEVEEEINQIVQKMVICHHPPGNPTNTQELEIPISAWAAHQAHGDTPGPCPEVEEEIEEEPEQTMVICHHPPGNPTNTQELTIPISAWAAHQAHGDTPGTCPEIEEVIEEVPEQTMVICHHPPGNPTNTQELTIPISAWAAHQAHGDTPGACPEIEEVIEEVPEQTMVICHHPPGNPTNTQELTIPISAWAAHQAHGDTPGACPEIEEVIEEVPEQTMVICHHPPGNPTNTQELTIPISAWAAHQAHGDTPGACPEIEEVIEEVPEQTMVICHHPPGNPTNTQELEIPISAWAAHQAHGDTPGPCPEIEEVIEEVPEQTMVICHHPPGNPTNTQELTIPISAWAAHQAHGDTPGACPEIEEVIEEVPEQTMVICHHPPGNPTNTQELTIPISAWAAHQAHGDTPGACPEIEEVIEEVPEQTMVICHHPPGNPTNTQELTIPISAWAAHQAHGDTPGPCPEVEEEIEEEEETEEEQETNEEEIENENGLGSGGPIKPINNEEEEEEEEEEGGKNIGKSKPKSITIGKPKPKEKEGTKTKIGGGK